jgi:hypothetical protein
LVFRRVRVVDNGGGEAVRRDLAVTLFEWVATSDDERPRDDLLLESVICCDVVAELILTTLDMLTENDEATENEIENEGSAEIVALSESVVYCGDVVLVLVNMTVDLLSELDITLRVDEVLAVVVADTSSCSSS